MFNNGVQHLELSIVYYGEVEALITDFLIDAIVLVMENHKKNPDDLTTFISSLSAYKGLKIYFLSIVDRLLATEHMKKFGLDFDDATTCQTIKRMNITTLVSFDDDFNVVKGLKRTQPDVSLWFVSPSSHMLDRQFTLLYHKTKRKRGFCTLSLVSISLSLL